jgi:hypothetical protein
MFALLGIRNPVGVVLLQGIDPRVAAKSGNPGLNYVTASRFGKLGTSANYYHGSKT